MRALTSQDQRPGAPGHECQSRKWECRRGVGQARAGYGPPSPPSPFLYSKSALNPGPTPQPGLKHQLPLAFEETGHSSIRPLAGGAGHRERARLSPSSPRGIHPPPLSSSVAPQCTCSAAGETTKSLHREPKTADRRRVREREVRHGGEEGGVARGRRAHGRNRHGNANFGGQALLDAPLVLGSPCPS